MQSITLSVCFQVQWKGLAFLQRLSISKWLSVLPSKPPSNRIRLSIITRAAVTTNIHTRTSKRTDRQTEPSWTKSYVDSQNTEVSQIWTLPGFGFVHVLCKFYCHSRYIRVAVKSYSYVGAALAIKGSKPLWHEGATGKFKQRRKTLTTKLHLLLNCLSKITCQTWPINVKPVNV